MMEIGIIGAIILALDIYAIWCILHEPWEGTKKVLWVAIVLLFNIFGMIAYFAFFRTTRGNNTTIFPPPRKP